MKKANEYFEGLRPKTNLDDKDLIYLDIRKEPFDIYGLYDPIGQPVFKRLPDEVANQCNFGVKKHYLHTSGGRIRFCTDSLYLCIQVFTPEIYRMNHMTLLGSSGFDIYEDFKERSVFLSRFTPEVDSKDWYEMRIRFDEHKLRYLTLNFPLYNSVNKVYIGVQEDSILEHGMQYNYKTPVIYYGSSITQGGCASRPGNAYEAIISRMCDTDYISLGFSGSALGDEAMAMYIAGMDMSVFVLDYDHNAPSIEHLINTHEKFFNIIRNKKPDLPVIFISKPDFSDYSFDKIKRRDIIYKTYIGAVEKGDKNVYFIDGRSLFGDDYRDCCTVDGCHPNDLGFLRMAQKIGQMIKELI
ncbi:MAG: SGNH/GDSL hydrolase family protein [Clostridia bacterium]|nr:SGNH/GDSL hydrolase family protein [Clostridia bacterium]